MPAERVNSILRQSGAAIVIDERLRRPARRCRRLPPGRRRARAGRLRGVHLRERPENPRASSELTPRWVPTPTIIWTTCCGRRRRDWAARCASRTRGRSPSTRPGSRWSRCSTVTPCTSSTSTPRPTPRRWSQAIAEHGIDMIDTTPSMFAQLRAAGLLTRVPLAVLALGGEALGGAAWAFIRDAVRRTAMTAFNCYGPTETTVEAVVAAIDRVRRTVDRAADPAHPRLRAGLRVAAGAVRGRSGELYLAGAQLARGYLGRAAETVPALRRRPVRRGRTDVPHRRSGAPPTRRLTAVRGTRRLPRSRSAATASSPARSRSHSSRIRACGTRASWCTSGKACRG